MQKYSGFVPIIGAPNAGKSTLLNSLLGEKLSIVTPKPQTTRNNITGILTKDDYQIIFLDTPGIIDPKYKLQQFMSREIDAGMIEADVVLFIIDSNKYSLDEVKINYEKYLSDLKKAKIFIVLNKIDLLRKEDVLKLINDISGNFKYDEIFPVSAQTGFNVNELVINISKNLPEHDFYFESEYSTTQPEKFFVSEIIRKNILRFYTDEIPFSVFVDIEEFKERDNGKDFINASLIVERNSQKSILIGENGSKIKNLGKKSRLEIEEFLSREVYLELFVKVKKDWKNDEKFLKKNFNKSSAQINTN